MIEKATISLEFIKKLNLKYDDISPKLDELLDYLPNILDEEREQDYYTLKDLISDLQLFRNSLTTLEAELNGYKGIQGDIGLKGLLKEFINSDK